MPPIEHAVRVLVVDDEADSRDSVRDLLEGDGYEVRTAANAAEAVAALAEFQPLCVLLDLGMPQVSGAELAGHIRKTMGGEVVMIVLTASTQPADHAAAEKAGVDYVLHKPLDVARLRRMLPKLS